ncbi:hypothetical protein C8035_v000820, partial [Colletotrichum spinosum]
MKFIAPTLLALGFVASSNAAFCNAGWSLEAGASCPPGDDYKYVYCVSHVTILRPPPACRRPPPPPPP